MVGIYRSQKVKGQLLNYYEYCPSSTALMRVSIARRIFPEFAVILLGLMRIIQG